MYSPSVTQRNIQLAQAAVAFPLTPVSVATARLRVDYFNDLTEFNEKGDALGWKRPLTAEESQYIQSERILCKLDFLYASARYMHINDYRKELVLFTPNKAQRIKLDIWARCEEAGQAIEELNLKARRLGVSTLIELVLAWLTAFYSGSTALVASSDPEKSRDMADIIRLVYDMMPWWLLPKKTTSRTGELYEFFEMKSKITVRWGNQTSGIGRGGSPNLAHLSELPDFDDPEEKVEAALLRAIIPSPRVFIALESTAKGKGNWWHDKWQDAKEHWPDTRLRPVFLPWFVGDDIYPEPTWLLSHPIPADWQPLDITVAHAATAERYVHVNQLLNHYLGDNWRMSRAQMWYWQFNREEARRTKALHKFLEEMPGDDIEAFQSPHGSVFDAEMISEVRSRIPDPQVFEIRGALDEIGEYQHYFGSEHAGEPHPITAHWNENLPAAEYALQPLNFQGYSNLSPVGKLIIWEWPEEGAEYGIGVDCSYGKGKDLSAVEVMRQRTYTDPERQVAEFVSPLLDSHLLWPYVFAIGTLYSTMRDGRRQQPRIAIELAANGQEVQRELRDRGWYNFHQRVPDDAKTVDYSREYRLGFETTRKSRPKVTQGLERAVRDKTIIINSPWLLEECGGLIWNADKERLEAGYGSTDDRYMALGIIRESFRQTETPTMRVMAHQQRAEDKAQREHHPTFRIPDYARPEASDWYKEHEREIAEGLIR